MKFKNSANWKLKISLTGKYDKGPAILSVSAGAGGQDAEDWAGMLYDVCEIRGKRGWKTKVIHGFGDFQSKPAVI